MFSLILTVALFQGQVSTQAKIAFDAIDLNSKNCSCQNCDCKDCKCKDNKCECKDCNSFEAIYTRCIKEGKVIVLAIDSPNIENVTWKIVHLKSLSGEKPGYIVGVPKDGKLIRLDFSPTTSRQRIRLDVLHVYYPLTAGYVECPTCPYGRNYVGR